MILDRIAQVALVFFGALVLVLLILGLSVSCRETAADPLVTVTVASPDFPGNSTVIPLPPITPSAIPPFGPSATPTPQGSGDTSSATLPAPQASPGATDSATQPTAPTVTATSPAGTGGLTPGATIRHGVSRGEWVLQIARCYSVTYESVLAANHLPNPDYILPGAILTIPNIGSLGRITGPPCVVSYSVVAGDTWDSLALRYGTTPAILRRANPGALAVGRSIWVPRVP